MISLKVSRKGRAPSAILRETRLVIAGTAQEICNDAVRIIKRELWTEENRAFIQPHRGGLFSTFAYDVLKTADGARLDVSSSAPYATIHDAGGTIRPKLGRNGLLIWRDPKTGRWFSKRKVKIKRKNYFKNTVKRSIPQLRIMAARTMKRNLVREVRRG